MDEKYHYPEIKIAGLDQYNLARIAQLSVAHSNKDMQELVTKLAATCNVPFEKLGFTQNNDEMQLLYQHEQSQHLARKATRAGKAMQGLVVHDRAGSRVDTHHGASPVKDEHGRV